MDGAHAVAIQVQPGRIDRWQGIAVVDLALFPCTNQASVRAQGRAVFDCALAPAGQQVSDGSRILAEQHPRNRRPAVQQVLGLLRCVLSGLGIKSACRLLCTSRAYNALKYTDGVWGAPTVAEQRTACTWCHND